MGCWWGKEGRGVEDEFSSLFFCLFYLVLKEQCFFLENDAPRPAAADIAFLKFLAPGLSGEGCVVGVGRGRGGGATRVKGGRRWGEVRVGVSLTT